MTKEIQLTQGRFAIVDDEDFDRINQYKWHFTSRGYATRTVRSGSKSSKEYTQWAVLMHREIMGAKDDQEVDHINHNRLDQRRCNLRLCQKHGENTYNRMLNKNSTTGYKGVTKQHGVPRLDGSRILYYRARINAGGKMVMLGFFDNPEDAARAYDTAAIELHGEFAYLNFKKK